MARIRTIKPEMPKDELLASLPLEARYLFAFLPTQADKMGRLEDRPRVLKLEVFPWDQVDVEDLLNQLSCHFIERYQVLGRKYIQIVNFSKHQRVHPNEPESTIPPNPRRGKKYTNGIRQTTNGIRQPDNVLLGTYIRERKGKEGKGREGVLAPVQAQDGLVLVSNPEPKNNLTPTQQIVEAYKVAKGIDQKNKGWNKQNFGRYSKSAKGLLECFDSDIQRAAAYLFTFGVDFDDKGLDWTLETVARKAWDNKGKLAEAKDEYKYSEMDADRILERGRPKQVTSAGSLAKSAIAAIGERALEGAGPSQLDEFGDPEFDAE